MGKNEVLMLFLLSFSYLTPSTAPKLRRCCHCSSPCGCLQALTWKSGWQLSVLQIQREAQGSAKQDACRIYLLQSALPSSLHNPLMQWAKRHLALLWNRNGSRKTGFNARSNQRERAIEARRELPMPVSLEVMSTRTAGKGLRRLGVPLDRQSVPQKTFAGFILRILSQALSQHSAWAFQAWAAPAVPHWRGSVLAPPLLGVAEQRHPRTLHVASNFAFWPAPPWHQSVWQRRVDGARSQTGSSGQSALSLPFPAFGSTFTRGQSNDIVCITGERTCSGPELMGSWSFCVTEFCMKILGSFFFSCSNCLIHSFNKIVLLHRQNTDSPCPQLPLLRKRHAFAIKKNYIIRKDFAWLEEWAGLKLAF